MTYQTEFPAFNPAEMPAVPPSWEDVSWHNNACPSFLTENEHYEVFVNYADPQWRDYPCQRFVVLSVEEELLDHVLLETDDWDEVLKFCAKPGAH